MLKENLRVKITDDMIVDRASFDELLKRLKDLRTKTSRLGVAEFKNLTGVSRKYAIPLLEYLDRTRITRRVGDERMIL